MKTAVKSLYIIAIYIIAIFLLTPNFSSAEERKLPDYAPDYQKNIETAHSIYLHEMSTWTASEHLKAESRDVLQKIGYESFSWLDENGDWNVVYGNYNHLEDKYITAVYYKYQGDRIFRLDPAPDENSVLPRARALYTVRDSILNVIKKRIPISWYVIKEGDKIHVWILPKVSLVKSRMFGFEKHFVLDETGKELLESHSFDQRETVACDETSYVIDRHSQQVPSVGDVFCMILHRNCFANIYAECREYIFGLDVESVEITPLIIPKDELMD